MCLLSEIYNIEGRVKGGTANKQLDLALLCLGIQEHITQQL